MREEDGLPRFARNDGMGRGAMTESEAMTEWGGAR
jgi:hypothetical protein